MTTRPEPSLKSLAAVFGTLLLLTGITVGASLLDLGPLSTPVALAIAGVKAALVALFFMEVRIGPKLVWVFSVSGLLWLGILLTLTLSDYLTRRWLP